MKINHLTPAEENLMRLFWKMNSFYLKDVMEQHPEPKPHQNTVSTYLKILVEKGYLSTEKEGRIFKYTILVPIVEYRKFLLKELAQHFFNNSGNEILELLMSENMISQNNVVTSDIKVDIKPEKVKAPKFEYAEEILNPKLKKDKRRDKDKKKKKKKD
jgi:BlaI family transcriptional regulator, penicillinase repressor